MDAQRILVTGGAGFLGTHLCARLLSMGHAVTCVDSLVTGRLRNLTPLLHHPRFTFIQQDILAPLNLSVDAICNLACPASPAHYQRDPVHTFKTCVLGSVNLLELAHKLRATILQASTSEVYGDPQVHPQHEDYRGNVNPIGPRACYDEGKRAAETLFADYHRQHGLQVRVARIFNTYGPGMAPDDGRVVANFITQALRGEPLTVYGKGQQTRSFCYVDDLIDGLIKLMDAPVTAPVNLGNPHEFTVAALAELVLELTESTAPIHYAPLPQDDPTQRRPAIDRAKAQLHWEPRISLRQGLQRTIDYFRGLM